jgi:hypothetical protein
VPDGRREAAPARPAAVPVHDDRDRLGDLGQVALDERTDARKCPEAGDELDRG